MSGDAIRGASGPVVNVAPSARSDRPPSGSVRPPLTPSGRPTAFNAPSDARLTYVLIDGITKLRAMADDWARLLDRSATNELALHPDWMLTWWDVFGNIGGRTLRTVAFYDGRSLVGLAPMLARKHKYKPGIPFRRLELLATGEDEFDEIASDYVGVIVERGYELSVANVLTNALVAGELGSWDELVFTAMSGEGPFPALLRDALNEAGIPTTLEERTVSPYVPLPATWEEYLAQLKPSKRSQLRKSMRALDAWADGTLTIERVRAPEDLERGKAILERLHRERWEGDGVYRSDRYRSFHDRMMPKLLDLGALDLGWMSVRGQPVAAYYNFRWRRRVGFYQAGRKLSVPEDVRVGVTMHALLIRNAIERGMVEYDFLAGTSQYKMALSLKTRPLVSLRAARPSVVESMRRAAEEAKRLREVAAALTGEPHVPEPVQAEPTFETTEITIVSLNAHTLDDSVRPFFFGQGNRALFGWFHPSRATISQRRAVVIAPPLGYENICAYPAMRTFAERLSEAGYPVMRFDYDGTGDSAGLESDPGRVRAWLDSVGDAIDQVRALSGLSEVCVFGIRMGATLAAAACAERGDVERLVLWNPCTTGRSYAREMKMFRQYAEQSGELQARPNTLAEGDEESGGFLLTKETLEDLKKLDLSKLTKKPAPRVLVLGRDDVPDDDKVARAFEALGANATYEKPPGYSAMMVAPHKTVFPEAVFTRTRDWLGEMAEPSTPAVTPPATTARQQGIVAPGVREEGFRFGIGDTHFGILTEPAEGKSNKPLIIFTNTAGNYRIGPNRMYVEMARKLATLGIPSFRMDVSGIGDSAIYDLAEQNHPYGDQLARDVRMLVTQLSMRGRAKRFGVAGLCSGAFVGYHAAVAEPAIESITLINPQTFVWEEGMSLEVNALARRDAAEYYKRRLFAPEAWKKLFSGGVDPRNAVNAVRGRVFDAARSGIARAKATLPGAASGAKPSELARAFETLCDRGCDVHIIFAGNDPGIDNLNEKVGPSMRGLQKRPNFTIDTIEGPDHSFTPLWAQAELEKVLVGHLATTFAGSKPRKD